MLRLVFRPGTPLDIPVLRDLADRIWRESYAAMLAPAQIDHMLGWMYAPEVIAAEMARGHLWQIAEIAGRPVGYLAISVTESRTADLHKLYLLPEHQGAGLGQQMLAHARSLASRQGATEIRLRVNKTNGRALRSYERAGFRVVDALVADIGGGFVMDDYVLALRLDRDPPTPIVKICGLSTPATVEAAIAAGADQIGLVFFPKSPRHVSLDLARDLADQARGRVDIVALTVDAGDAALDGIMEAIDPDWLQLHGAESPDRVAAIRARTGRALMKAVGIADAADLSIAEPYRNRVNRILFDAKPPKNAALPGGNGIAFDWDLLRGTNIPFMLSGGLSPKNVTDAIRRSGAKAVDVSSGVETAPGLKDPELISAFVAAAKSMVRTGDIPQS